MRLEFRVFNFRRKDERRHYFDTENFQIYGIAQYSPGFHIVPWERGSP